MLGEEYLQVSFIGFKNLKVFGRRPLTNTIEAFNLRKGRMNHGIDS